MMTYITTGASLLLSTPIFYDLPHVDVKCPAGQVYQVCGSACNATCSNIAEDPNCEDTCIEGCACPSGLTLNDKNQCVPVDECPCKFDDKQIAAGESFVKASDVW